MRDLNRDIEILQKATPSPWKVERCHDGSVNLVSKEHQVIYGYDNALEFINDADIEFIVEARSGWSEAVRRAISAEKEVKRLREIIDEAYTYLPIDPKRSADLLRREFIRTEEAE